MNIQAEDVLNALFNPNEKVCLRVFADRKGDPFSGQKYSCEAAKFNDYKDTLKKHNEANRGIFYVVNLGGDNDKDIIRINAQFVEMDEGTFEEQQAKIDAFALPPSMIIRTRKSLHTYWFMKDAKVEKFRVIQKGLVKHFHGDPACVNESRVMRLPGFNHCKQEPVEVVCISFHPERKYTQEQLEEILPIEEEAVTEVKKGTEKGLNIVQHGCDFIKYCKEHAAELSEHDWYAMISNLAVFDGGDRLIHELSTPYPGYSESVTNKKINHFIESGTKPMTCAVIAEKGFKCPRLEDGSCSCKAPAALCYQPMSVTGLRDIISGLTAAGDVVVDMQTAIEFVEEYLYNVDPATAGTIINYELKKVFKDFKAAELKSLISRQKQLAKDYQSGQKARQNKLEVSDFQEWYFIITTAGNDRHSIAFELHTKAVDILEGRRVDPTFYPVVYGLKDDEDWEDEANWYKVNPSLGYTVDIERLRDAYREAKQNPADEITFKWLRMNMWVSSTTAWIPDAIYMRGNEPIDMDALEGRDCYAGLDLSSTGDITALVLMFPPRDKDEKYIVLPFFWVPEDTIPRRVKANSVPYDVWEKQGHILATEGNVIHYDFIEKFIYDLAEKYHILEIAVDRWNATQMIQNLEGEGFTTVPFGQGFSSMSAPTKEFYRLLMEGQIIHGGHPVLRWMAGNVVIDTDPAGNIKVTKAKSKEKIDGIVAAIMALDRCIRQEGQGGSVYDHE